MQQHRDENNTAMRTTLQYGTKVRSGFQSPSKLIDTAPRQIQNLGRVSFSGVARNAHAQLRVVFVVPICKCQYSSTMPVQMMRDMIVVLNYYSFKYYNEMHTSTESYFYFIWPSVA